MHSAFYSANSDMEAINAVVSKLTPVEFEVFTGRMMVKHFGLLHDPYSTDGVFKHLASPRLAQESHVSFKVNMVSTRDDNYKLFQSNSYHSFTMFCRWSKSSGYTVYIAHPLHIEEFNRLPETTWNRRHTYTMHSDYVMLIGERVSSPEHMNIVLSEWESTGYCLK
jgi:hypothetical protein